MKLEDALLKYRDQLLKIIEIEKNPDEYLKTTMYANFYKSGEDFLNAFGWNREDVGLSPQAASILVTLGVLRRGYHSNRDKRWFRLKMPIEELEERLGLNRETDEQEKIEVPEDIFDFIIGYDDYKWIVKKSLTAEDPVHILFVGSPGSGKSAFLLEISRIPGAQYYAAGGNITRAGLVELLAEEKPKILIIDEIDKADNRELSVLLSLMESGLVTKLISGTRIKLQLNTRVYAACNRLSRLPEELKSRFLKLSFEPYTREQFIEVSKKLLTIREKKDEKLATAIAETLADTGVRDVREAIRVARLVENEEDLKRLKQLYLKGKVIKQ